MPREAEDADRIYRERAERYDGSRDRCVKRARQLTHARLAVFLAASVSFLLVFEVGAPASYLLLAASLALAVAFLVLIVRHNQIERRRRWFDQLAALCRDGRARIARQWDALPVHDPVAVGDTEPYADDLDLFGHVSLFTLLGTVATPPGRTRLRRWLLDRADRDTILARQEAVAELIPLIDLREEITARGRSMSKATAAGAESFLAWAEDRPWLAQRPLILWTARSLPPLTLLLIALNVAAIVPYAAWVLALAVNLTFSYTVGAHVHRIFDRAFARENALQGYAELIGLVERARFTAPLLLQIQDALSAQQPSAYLQMKRLHRLLALAEVRLSMLHAAIQALTLWDFHVLRRLERWQLTAGRHARGWLAALGELDALAALAGLRFENPGWAFPEICYDRPQTVEATGLGHPLIPESVRVANDVQVGPPGTFLFITGSNMSGKSTLLRAIGINVVLARTGGPVCASSMRLPPLSLATSMRVYDSLQHGLSHFMAELKRLKRVIEAARHAREVGEGPLLYLLDDILQGTNTGERQIAARKVIGQLLAEETIGGVTSHDLALADTEPLAKARHAVHFSEQIREEPDGPRISFDYKLRPGVATSKNALKLLQIVGLEQSAEGGAGNATN